MNPEQTPETLLGRVHRFYPRGLVPDDPRYEASEEARRLMRVLEKARDERRAWDDFVEKVHEDFPDCLHWDRTLLQHDPCYTHAITLPGVKLGSGRYDVVVCMLSLLAPVYAIYATHQVSTGPVRESWLRFPPLPPEFQAQETKLATRIESTFGFTRLPEEVLFLPVPDLVPPSGILHLGEARLIDCLFTPHRH